MVQLVLSRVTRSDLDTLIPIEFAAFEHEGSHGAMYGPKTASSMVAAKMSYLRAMASDPSDVWVKISDADAGDRMVCAGNWKVYPTYVAAEVDAKVAAVERMTAGDMTVFEDARQKEDAAMLTKEFMTTRYRSMREAHICKVAF